jgi:hypothetical protein
MKPFRLNWRWRGLLSLLPWLASMPLQAGSVALPTGGLSCTYTDAFHGTPTTCTGGDSAFMTTGVSFYLGGEDNDLGIRGNGSLTESTSETLSSTLASGTAIPYSYDFSLQEENLDPDWQLTIELLDGHTVIATTGTSISGTYGLSSEGFSGSGTLTTTAADASGQNLTAEFILTLSGAPDNSLTIVNIAPGSTIDLGPVPASDPTPEPATFGLIGSGLAAAGFVRRKRG